MKLTFVVAQYKLTPTPNEREDMKSHTGEINRAVTEYLQAREDAAKADEVLKQAENAMRLAMAGASVQSAIVSGVKVSLVEGRRPSYDAEKLQQMVKPNLFKTLIKTVIDGEKFKAALKLGTLPQDIADACTKYSEYTQVRVTQATQAQETASVSAVA